MELVKVTFECGHTNEVYTQYVSADTTLCASCRQRAWRAAGAAEAAKTLAVKDAALLELRRPLIERAAELRAWAEQEAREN